MDLASFSGGLLFECKNQERIAILLTVTGLIGSFVCPFLSCSSVVVYCGDCIFVHCSLMITDECCSRSVETAIFFFLVSLTTIVDLVLGDTPCACGVGDCGHGGYF